MALSSPSDLYFLAKDIFHMILIKIKNLISKDKSYSIVVHLEQFPHEDNFVSIDKDNNLVLNWSLQKEDIENLKSLLEDNSKFIQRQ